MIIQFQCYGSKTQDTVMSIKLNNKYIYQTGRVIDFKLVNLISENDVIKSQLN